MTADKHFVWIKGQKGSCPQIWYDNYNSEGKLKPCIFSHKVEQDEMELTMEQLAEKYKDRQNG